MKDFEITDSGFNKRDSLFYRLSIQLSLNGFSFCLIDTRSNSILVVKEKFINEDLNKLPNDYYCQYLYDFIINEELFKLSYKSISIVYITKNSTLVPASVYEKTKESSLFKINIQNSEDEILQSNKLDLFDAFSLFSIPDCVMRVLERQFINYNIRNQSDVLVNCAISKSQNRQGAIMFLNCNYGIVDIVVVDSRNLLFNNSYTYNNNDDILYYMANVNEQLNIDNKHTEIILSGNIEKTGELANMIMRYFSKVSFIDENIADSLSAGLKDIILYKYSLLLNSLLCE